MFGGNLPRNIAICQKPQEFSGKKYSNYRVFCFLLRKKGNFFSTKVNQNSVRVSEMTLLYKAPLSSVQELFFNSCFGVHWPVSDLLQIRQSWYFQDFSGLCLTEGQQDRLLTLNFLAPLPEGGRPVRPQRAVSEEQVGTGSAHTKASTKVGCV